VAFEEIFHSLRLFEMTAVVIGNGVGRARLGGYYTIPVIPNPSADGEVRNLFYYFSNSL